MAERCDIFKPSDQTQAQMMATWATALSAVAWDIGTHVDRVLARRIGPGWAAALERHRRDKRDPAPRVNPWDPSWVFAEPRHTDSVIATVYPLVAGPLAEAFRQVNHRRNDWYHRNVAWSLSELDESIEALRNAVRLVGDVPARAELDDLAGHLFDLRTQRILPTPRETELRELLQQEQQHRADDQGRLERAVAELRRLQSADSATGEIVRRLEAERGAYAAQAAQLDQRIKELEARREPDVDDLLPVGLRPGDPWPQDIPRGSRKLRLLRAPQRDIVDPARGFLSDDLGDHVHDVATRWQQVMPQGGPIQVTNKWNCAGVVHGRWTYLGRLDAPPEQDRTVGAAPAEFLLPRTYRFTGTDVVDQHAGRTLSAARGVQQSHRVVAALAAGIAQARDQGLFDQEDTCAIDEGTLEVRIGPAHHVFAPMCDTRGYVATVDPADWFPR